jgi:hypothetical protein
MFSNSFLKTNSKSLLLRFCSRSLYMYVIIHAKHSQPSILTRKQTTLESVCVIFRKPVCDWYSKNFEQAQTSKSCFIPYSSITLRKRRRALF